MDRDRVRPEYVQDIFDTLNFLELPWDEGPRNAGEFEREFSQVWRMDKYREILEQLRREEKVFACACPRTVVYQGTCREKKVSFEAENVGWRLYTDDRQLEVRVVGGLEGLDRGGVGAAGQMESRGAGEERRVGEEKEVREMEEGGEGKRGLLVKEVLPEELRDFIVRKKDGFPAYQLTSLVDDLYYGVDLVVRGEDLRASTLAQHFLAEVLGLQAFGHMTFYHHPLLTEAGRKLSKSAGDTSIRYLRSKGLRPADVYTLIAEMMGYKETVGSWEELGRLLR